MSQRQAQPASGLLRIRRPWITAAQSALFCHRRSDHCPSWP